MGSIKEQLETLVTLQKAEIEIRRIEQELAGIDGRTEALGKEVLEYENRVSEFQTKLDILKKQYRSDENEIKVIDTQITKSKEKLRAVKTNKEYQSILKEIDELKHKSSGIEDQMLEYLDRIESAESETALQKADLADVKIEVAAKQEEIRKLAEGRHRTLADLEQERDSIWETVPAKLQTLYVRVRHQGHGIAVAAILDAVCQVCRMNIPPQLYNELQRLDEIRMCPNCQRIIYPQVLLERD